MNLKDWAIQQGYKFPKDLGKLNGLIVKSTTDYQNARELQETFGTTIEAYERYTGEPCVKIYYSRGQNDILDCRFADEVELAAPLPLVENDL